MRNKKDSVAIEEFSLPGENVNYSKRDFGEIKKFFFMNFFSRIKSRNLNCYPVIGLHAYSQFPSNVSLLIYQS